MKYCPISGQSTVHHAGYATIPATTATTTTAGRISAAERRISTTTTMATESGMAEEEHVTGRGV